MAKILVVAASAKGPKLQALLEAAGHEVRLAGGFHEAVATLAHETAELLVTEVQLGAFNGLHVVIRHRVSHPNMRVIVIGPYYDSVLAQEAANCGATYVAASTDDPELVGLVAGLVADNNPARRWPRKKPVDPLVVRITDRSARVLDLSYGGMSFETSDATALPPSLKIEFPDAGVAIEAQPIWCQPSPVGSWLCGVAISSDAQPALRAWRQLVDAVPTAS
jgi:ActR/RegA family two-component response regulator